MAFRTNRWAAHIAGTALVTLTWLSILQSCLRAEDARGPVRLGVLTDMSSLYADNAGPGSLVAAQMAVEDFGGSVLGRKIEVIVGDHQNKPDVGSTLVRKWIDVDNVGAVFDVPNSGVALAVQTITREKKKIFMASGAATSRLTGDQCSPTTVHWTYDTYALAKVIGKALTRMGSKKWYFLSADYALGAQLERDGKEIIESEGGSVIGGVRHPINSPDFSSFLLQAQASNSDVIALANAGGDLINSLKQAQEFGIGPPKQRLVGLLAFIADVNSLGLKSAKGLVLSAAFYWDMNDETRAWSKRFIEKTGKVPTMIHAGTYGAVVHYLKAIAKAQTDEGPSVAKVMRETPVNDFMTKNGRIRDDGRLIRDMYLFEVKSPEESKGKYDYYKLLATIPGDEAFKTLKDGECPRLKN